MSKPLPIEPLARLEDAGEFRQGLARYRDGAWDEARWTGFRVRYGVYGQRTPGKHMIRIKVPGGVLPVSWLQVIAEGMKRFAGERAHLTTRQDIQLYDVEIGDTAPLLAYLHANGVTTRESGGNTLRNFTACPQAGLCPAERVDAGQVAQALSGLWLRRSIAQRMPRKVKIAVSGCAQDCAGGWYHDLAFVATVKDGQNGFRVLGGGGLGARPMPGVELLDFVTEENLPAVIEAVMRVHHNRSDRANKSVSRFKFTLKRLNIDEIRSEVKRELEVAASLPQRPLAKFDWKVPTGEKPARLTGPRQLGENNFALVARPANGSLSISQIEGLHDLALANGLDAIRITTTQEIVLPDLTKDKLGAVRLWLKSVEIPEVGDAGPDFDLVGCLGTSACPIGVTNAAGLVPELAELKNAGGLKIRASGCHNACSQHHVADIGLHGVTRLVNGKPMPHYQIHLGGDFSSPGGLALEGPTVPARKVPAALTHVLAAWNDARASGETIRAWAERLGEKGLNDLILPAATNIDEAANFFDWGESGAFSGPATGKGDCAAPQVANDHLADLALDALERMDRALLAGLWSLALHEAERAIVLAARRRLELDKRTKSKNPALPIIDRLRGAFKYRPILVEALEQLESARQIALVTGEAQTYRTAIADWLEQIESAEPLTSSKENVDAAELEQRVAAL